VSDKELDTESGLDNFGARYDSSRYGRFMTPDWSAKPMGVPYADINDPQSLNLYSYARNRPLTYIDRDGHCGEPITFTICVGVVVLTVVSIYDHFHETHAKAEAAAAAIALDRVCPSSPTCNATVVHEQTVTAIREAGLSAAETGLSTVPQAMPPASGTELIIGGAADLVKDAAIEAAKKKLEQQEQQQQKQQSPAPPLPPATAKCTTTVSGGGYQDIGSCPPNKN
jgi:RHS repeat-associated protein